MTVDVLVLGGTGFIGRPVVQHLVDRGATVAVFHRGHRGGDLPDNVHRVLGDRRRIEDHCEALRSLSPRAVIDVIAYTEPEASACVAALGDATERFVVVSSQDVYAAYDRFRGLDEEPSPLPLSEDAPLRSRLYPYRGQGRNDDPWVESYDKILVERAYRSGSTPVTVLRLPMVYGPGDRQHRTMPYLRRIEDGRGAICLQESRASWVATRGFVEDVADAIAIAALEEGAAGRTYNIGETDPLTELAWARAIGDAAGWRGRIAAVPDALWPSRWATPYDWSQSLTADTSRAQEELSPRTTLRERALEATIGWERGQNPPLPPLDQDYALEDRILDKLETS